MVELRYYNGNQITVGASKVAALLGFSPWMTPSQAWDQILGKESGSSEEDASAVRKELGLLLEDDIAEIFQKRYRKKIISQQYKFINGIFHATVDALTDEGEILEFKTSRNVFTSIPYYYRIQMMMQMYCSGIKHSKMVGIGGNLEFFVYDLQYNEEETLEYVKHIERIYEEYFDNGVYPREGGPSLLRAQKDLTDQDFELLSRYRSLKEEVARLEGEIGEIRQKILDKFPMTCDLKYDGNVVARIYRTTSFQDRVDVARLKELHPDIYTELSKKNVVEYQRIALQ